MMRDNILYTLSAVPPEFPEQVAVPETFLHQIDTTFGIWIIRIILLVVFFICLLYARNAEKNKYTKMAGDDETIQTIHKMIKKKKEIQ